MKRSLALLLGSFVVAAGAAATTQSPEPQPSREAPYQFALAKLLFHEGSLLEAVEAFEHAAQLAPDEPYIRLEYAEALSHLAQSQRDPAARQRRLSRAAEEVERARQLAPDNLDVLRALSQLYLAMADFDPQALPTAMEALEKIRQREPWDVQAMVALGQIRMARGEAAKAAEIFAEAVSYTPNHRILYGFLADASERAGDDVQAEKALEKILGLDPQDVETRIRVAELRSRRQDHRGALAVLSEVPEPLRDEPRLRYLQARELLMTGEPEKALETIDALRQEGLPSRLRFFLADLRGRVLMRLDRSEEAAQEIRSLLDLDPTNSDTVRTVTRQLVQLDREDDAVDALKSFLRERREAATTDDDQRDALETARLALAALHVERQQWDEAVAVLEPLLASEDPETRASGIVNSAEVLFQAGRSEEALALLKSHEQEPLIAGKRAELLLRSGEDSRARRFLRSLGKAEEPEGALAAVRAFQAQQRYQETLVVLSDLVAKHPSVEGYFLLGAAEERTGDVTGATETFERLLKLDPDHAPTLNYLGYMWAERGENLERALRLVQRAVEIDPHNGAYADSLGWAHYRLGNLEEARNYLERAAQLVPGDPVIFDHLGDLYSALGERLKAAEFYRRVLRMAGEGDAQDVDLTVVRHKLDQVSDE